MAPAAHVFVDDVEAPLLDPTDRHHLARVLRLRPGEAVTASDGRGRLRPCVVASAAGDVVLEATGPPVLLERVPPAVTVGFALTKGDRPEWVVQKLTEAGVDRIVPLAAARSVVRWDGDRALPHLARLRLVARGAAMQSRRVWLPEVAGVATVAEALALAGPEGAALAEAGGGRPSLDRPVVLVGPEGGWSPEELAGAPATVDLGPTVLRAETAAMAAGLLLCALRAGVVGPAGH